MAVVLRIFVALDTLVSLWPLLSTKAGDARMMCDDMMLHKAFFSSISDVSDVSTMPTKVNYNFLFTDDIMMYTQSNHHVIMMAAQNIHHNSVTTSINQAIKNICCCGGWLMEWT